MARNYGKSLNLNSYKRRPKILIGVIYMVAEANGRFFMRKDGKYFIYVPKHLVEDSGCPFRACSSVPVRIHFVPGEKRIIVEKI